jgi:hypothetical protein
MKASHCLGGKRHNWILGSCFNCGKVKRQHDKQMAEERREYEKTRYKKGKI